MLKKHKTFIVLHLFLEGKNLMKDLEKENLKKLLMYPTTNLQKHQDMISRILMTVVALTLRLIFVPCQQNKEEKDLFYGKIPPRKISRNKQLFVCGKSPGRSTVVTLPQSVVSYNSRQVSTSDSEERFNFRFHKSSSFYRSKRDSCTQSRKEQRGIRLLPNMQFLAKTQTLNKPWEPVFIPKFENYATDPNDLLLCPCRALLAYIKRTEVLRKSQRLFVTYQKNHHVEASKNSIARWIVNTVKYAYEHADTDTLQFVRAHDTRKLSTSWALFNGLSSQEILRAAHWSNETTFTSYYLKDVPDLESRFAKAAILHTANRRQKKY
ncbi:unnamed protein product [Mytilus edulis]|uniref:Tyr recombinase domain-containing protein n=1 Tax=Mytilus edulis TaxID=6550 RepID=A0A8S3R4U8_MYTED|nr:unnamed protein product [Mytilus edulis]